MENYTLQYRKFRQFIPLNGGLGSRLICNSTLLSVTVTSGTQHKYLILIINDTIDYFNEQRMEHAPCRTSCPGTAARSAARPTMEDAAAAATTAAAAAATT